MKKPFLFLFFFPFFSSAQSLLLNGGFEDENICTEYKINCAPEAWIMSGSALANYIIDINRSRQGEHCMTIEAGHTTRPYERTFIRSQLLCKMKKGEHYHFEMYVKSSHAVLDSLGIYLGPIDPLLERKPIHLLAPSLYLADNKENKFKNDSSWQKATLDYTANGNEVFITIANFSKNDITGNTGIRRRNQFMVYLDDISLVPVNPNERLCANWQEEKEEIYAQNERHQYLDRIIRLRSKTLQETALLPTLTAATDTLVLPDVLFATGKKELRNVNLPLLDSFCKSMAGKLIDSVVIEGHADNTGTVAFNEQLSAGRASVTATHLGHCSALAKIPIIARGWGSRRPIAPNDSPANRQRNRRVVLLVYFRE